MSWSDARLKTVIAPSMLSADWSRAGEVVQDLAACGCEWLHFDAMDGDFVPNITMGPMFVRALREHSQLHFDAHLMISNPEAYLGDFIEAGAESVSVHWEGNAHLHRLIHKIKDGGAKAGVVLNPATPPEVLTTILPDVDFVLVMSVNPGFGGQKFLSSSLDKLSHLREMRKERGLHFLLQVDGGISPETAPLAVAAGADVLVVGSSLFAGGQPEKNVQALRAAIADTNAKSGDLEG